MGHVGLSKMEMVMQISSGARGGGGHVGSEQILFLGPVSKKKKYGINMRADHDTGQTLDDGWVTVSQSC